ncbi:MAG: transglutaminase family protein [Trueperaceae bacterium]|nr:transglutaminase family protein [Trueperaceae bacterium]
MPHEHQAAVGRRRSPRDPRPGARTDGGPSRAARPAGEPLLLRAGRDPLRFPPKWDEVRASETLGYRVGYCTTKATLFLALCKAAGIPARVHTGLISVEIMRGIFPSFAFRALPAAGGHAWLEVELDGEWKPMDSYINDRRFYDGALKRLLASGRTTGFSLSMTKGPTSCAFSFGEKGFVHMGAVVEDHGIWEDVADYMASPAYVRMSRMQQLVFPWMARMSNRTIEAIRG